MELYPAEVASIKKQVGDWITHPDFELESTFGKSNQVGAVQFLAVAQRLKAKGYTALPQEDRLTITTPEHVRFTLNSLAVIQTYCRDDTMRGKPFVPQIKDRATADAQVDLDDYGVRIKLRKETSMARDDAVVKGILETWPNQRKAFRMIRRWSFDGDGLRIDLSVVRSTAKDRRGDFKWQRKFRDQDIMTAPPAYEIEVELVHKPDDTEEAAMKRLIRGVGEVLRGVQKHSLLIRTDTKRKVLAAYKDLTGTDLFRGPAPRTLQKVNFMPEREPGNINLRDGFNVTDKADGLRALGFCDSKGELFLIDMSMTVYRTGLQQPECRLSLVDGEWVTRTNDKPPKPMQQFLIFDIFYAADKVDVSKMPFQPGAAAPDGSTRPEEESRYNHIKNWVGKWNSDGGPKVVAAGVTANTKLQVGSKEFAFGAVGTESIFRAAARTLSAARPYYTDGLIFTPNAEPLPEKPAGTFMNQFKWKPPTDNTVDFLVKTVKVTGSKHQDRVTTETKETGELLSYKTLVLCVGGRTENPRDVILSKGLIPKAERGPPAKGEYKPVPFTPMEFPDPMASVCNLEVQRDADTGEEYVVTSHTSEPIQDNTIVEMAYDPSKPAGWRWTPLRVRMDKTERLQSGILGRTLNSEQVAEDVWNSIYDPITVSMITTGSEQPSSAEMAMFGEVRDRDTAARAYFKRGKKAIIDNAKAIGLKKFHNEWIKETILYPSGLSGQGKTLVDLACGVAADLHKWRRLGTKFVLGLDYAAKNIMDVHDSAYKRYLKVLSENNGSVDRAGLMVFAIADTSKPLVSGAAGSTDQEKDILRSVFGRVRPVGPVPPFVEENAVARLKMGADCVSCMFAIHYFFETPDKFNGFLKNLGDTMKLGGYFIGTTFDGDKVFNLLQGVEKGAAKTGLDGGSQIWRIAKQYDADVIPEGDEAFGMAIDVEFSTIGMEHREFLVPFKLLEDKMRLIGCELVKPDELKTLGLVNSTATFDASWEMAKKKGKNYVMAEKEKEFSFLNRWFIFKRVRQEALAEAVAVAEAAAGSTSIAPRRSGANAATATGAAALSVAPNVAPQATAQRTYAVGEILQFYNGAALKDSIGLDDPGAGRWLSLSAPFPIEDPYNEGQVYPTVEHYIAGMKVQLVKPELAQTLFGRDGTIHQRFLQTRVSETEGGTRQISQDRDYELLREETNAVKEAAREPNLKKYGAIVDPAAWALQKDRVLEEALTQRWKRDARLRRILEAARDKGKTLLYFTPGTAASNLGGVFRASSGIIEGANMVGKIYMRLAGFPDA